MRWEEIYNHLAETPTMAPSSWRLARPRWLTQRGGMTADRLNFAGYRFPAEIISYAVWLYFRFPLSLRMVEELLAARGITVSYETVRQ